MRFEDLIAAVRESYALKARLELMATKCTCLPGKDSPPCPSCAAKSGTTIAKP